MQFPGDAGSLADAFFQAHVELPRDPAEAAIGCEP